MRIKTYIWNKSLVDVLFTSVRLKLWTLQEPQKELVDDLQVRPARLVGGLVLFLVGIVAWLVGDGGQRAKNVKRYHGYYLGIDRLRKTALRHAYVVDDLVETCALDLFALQVGHRVHEVEYDAALFELLDEELLLLLDGRVLNRGQWLQLFAGGRDEAWAALLTLDFLRLDLLSLRERVDGPRRGGGRWRVIGAVNARRREQRARWIV